MRAYLSENMHHQYLSVEVNAFVNRNMHHQYSNEEVNANVNENVLHQYLNVQVIANEIVNLPHQHQYEFGKINSNLSKQRENVHHSKKSKLTLFVPAYFDVSGTRYQVPGTRYQVLGTS